LKILARNAFGATRTHGIFTDEPSLSFIALVKH
jgi:hypothetical protein